MSSISRLVFHTPRAGKPNPTEMPPAPGQADTRDRVVQHGSKGNTCWYYAYNQLRDRMGKHAAAQTTPARQFEKLASERRKQLSRHEDSLPDVCDQLNHPTTINVLGMIQRDTPAMFSLVVGLQGIMPLRDEFFASAHPNLYTFLVDKKFGERNAINTRFLVATGTPIGERHRVLRTKNPVVFPKALKQLSTTEKAPVLDAIVREISAERYGLVPGTWTPAHEPEVLVTALQEHGPQVINGIFGHSTYEKPPFKLKDVEGVDVYAWQKGSKRTNVGAITAHTVVLIGAQQEGAQTLVYFLDPLDESGPDKLPPVYGISYKGLVENVVDLNGAHTPGHISLAGYTLQRSNSEHATEADGGSPAASTSEQT